MTGFGQTNGGGYDLQMTAITLSPPMPVAGSTFHAFVTTRNIGTLNASGVTVAAWANHAGAAGCGEAPDASSTVPFSIPGQVDTNRFTLTAPSTPGSGYVFRAFVDQACAFMETSEANNQGAIVYTVTASNPPPLQADLRITSIGLSTTNPKPNKLFYAYVTVQNAGTAAAQNFYVSSWAKKAAAASCGEIGNAETFITSLGAGSSQTVTHQLRAPSGTRTLRSFVDSRCTVSESNESNNQSTRSY